MKFLIGIFFLMPMCLFATIKVAIIGDSISLGVGATPGNGYVDQLIERLTFEGKDVEIINRSYGSAYTDTLFQITMTLITQEKPDYIIYFIGINDCGLALMSGWTNAQLKNHLTSNFSNAFKRATGNCKRVILGGITCSFFPAYNTALAGTYSALITAFNCYPTMLLGPAVLAHSPDWVHPNNTGSQMISDLLYNALDVVGAF
ncbi:MAG: hypothetical protein H0V82_08785 [Candidatus Protochlamydia sp.]|nr:hypothetical protein [Candidatus Protochlamydia sp.]